MNAYALYCGDCRKLLLQVTDTAHVDLLLTDPPYGNALKTNYRERKRGALALCNDFAMIEGNQEPFDPAHLLIYRRVCLFGGNYFADKLPNSSSWIVWDKLAGLQSKRPWGFNDQADVEMAWTNLGGPARLIPHRWMGAMKESERRERRVHPTQKPVALMRAIIEHYTHPGDLIVDPYMGAGSTIIAALEAGRRAIGIEIAPEYYTIARRRVEECVTRLEVLSGTASHSSS